MSKNISAHILCHPRRQKYDQEYKNVVRNMLAHGEKKSLSLSLPPLNLYASLSLASPNIFLNSSKINIPEFYSAMSFVLKNYNSSSITNTYCGWVVHVLCNLTAANVSYLSFHTLSWNWNTFIVSDQMFLSFCFCGFYSLIVNFLNPTSNSTNHPFPLRLANYLSAKMLIRHRLWFRF